MNRAARLKWKARTRGKSSATVYEECFKVARQFNGPLTDREREISDRLVRGLGPQTWYHGGMAGRCVSDLLLPPHVTGADPRGVGKGALAQNRMRSVYFTNSIQSARRYAHDLAGGQVYAVEPMGRIELDSTDLRALILLDEIAPIIRCNALAMFPHIGFCADKAVVKEVLA